MSSVTAVPIPPIKRRYIVYLTLGIVLAVIAAAALAMQTGLPRTASGLQYEVLKAADGPKPTDTDVVLVNYEGRLPDGTVFDKSQQPTPFPVTGVVPGFSEGLKLMSKGSKYRFIIPAALGYGEKGAGPIPPNSPLEFEVELVDFLPEAVIRQMQMQQMMQQQQQGGAAPGAPGASGEPEGPPPGAIPGR